MEMTPISTILNKNRSDKCNGKHSYGLVYDSIFSSFNREAELDILESGIEYGGSLAAWKEYFPNARVTGVDIEDKRLSQFTRDDVEFVLSDIKQYQPGRFFDLIIEDGNHSNYDAIWAAKNLTEHLKPGGYLIIEDVQEGYSVPFLMWGQIRGGLIVTTHDMRGLTGTHDNFLIVIHRYGR